MRTSEALFLLSSWFVSVTPTGLFMAFAGFLLYVYGPSAFAEKNVPL